METVFTAQTLPRRFIKETNDFAGFQAEQRQLYGLPSPRWEQSPTSPSHRPTRSESESVIGRSTGFTPLHFNPYTIGRELEQQEAESLRSDYQFKINLAADSPLTLVHR